MSSLLLSPITYIESFVAYTRFYLWSLVCFHMRVSKKWSSGCSKQCPLSWTLHAAVVTGPFQNNPTTGRLLSRQDVLANPHMSYNSGAAAALRVKVSAMTLLSASVWSNGVTWGSGRGQAGVTEDQQAGIYPTAEPNTLFSCHTRKGPVTLFHSYFSFISNQRRPLLPCH